MIDTSASETLTSGEIERLPAFQALKARIVSRLHDLADSAGQLDLRIEQATVLGDEQLSTVIMHTADDLDALVFNVAVIGEFNRGKSTLINAILQRPALLTTAPLPNTAAITRIAALPGDQATEHYRVSYRDSLRQPLEGTDLNDIERFTNDRQKAGSLRAQLDELTLAESVERVDVWIASDFLRRSGIVLIDTPGLGAVTRAHQEVTEHIMPTIHAALFVFMVDPPIGAVEIAFLQFSMAYVNRFLFIMNDKHGTLAATNNEAAEVLAYAESELSAIGIDAPIVIGLNPRVYLNGNDGGFADFLPRLSDFLIESRGRALLDDAIRKAQRHASTIRTRAEHRLHDLDRQTDDLRAELAHGRQTADALQMRKQALIDRVDAEMSDIVATVAGDVDNLAVRIEQAVFNAIDSYGIGALREAHIHLPEVIKAAVNAWMQDKSTFVNGRFNRLYRNVIADLRELLADYTPDSDLNAITETHLSVKLGIEGIKLNGDVAMAVAAGIAIAAGIVLADLLTSGGVGAIVMLLAGAAGSGTAGAVLLQRVRTSLKTEVRKSLPPPNADRTMLSAVIEGYIGQDDQPVPGVRALINDEFATLSAAVKSTIATSIHNAWTPRLQELEAALALREAAGVDLAAQRHALIATLAQSGFIERDLDEINEALGVL